MKICLLILTAATSICFTRAATFPSTLKQCKQDSNLAGCLKDAIQDALPKMANGFSELEVPAIDPLLLPNVLIEPGSEETVNLIQNYTNVKITGLSKGTVNKVDMITSTPDALKFDVDYFVDKVVFASHYNTSGNIVSMRFEGDGECTLTLENLNIVLSVDGKTSEKEGKTYMKFEEVDVTLTPGLLILQFDNLFNGHPQLGPAMNKMLNENWKLLFDDVGHSYEDVVAAAIQNTVNIIFSQIPYDELIPQ